MKKKTVARWIGFGVACLFTYVGVDHFPMAHDLAQHKAFSGLSAPAWDFLVMAILVIGVLLLVLGGLAFYFSRLLRTGDPGARIFFLGLGLACLGRVTVEVFFPSTLAASTVAVTAQISFLCLCCLAAAWLSRAEG